MFDVGADRSATYVASKVLRDVGSQVQVLRAEGSAHDGEIVLRIVVHIDSEGFLGSDAMGCYNYHLSSVREDEKPRKVPCPPTASSLRLPRLAPDPTPDPVPQPQLPGDAVDQLSKALARVPEVDRHKPEVVRAAVTKAFLQSPKAVVEVGTAPDGTVGVAITVAGGQDCLAGRLLDRPDVWVPPLILVQAGEYGCRPEVFAAGLAKAPPH